MSETLLVAAAVLLRIISNPLANVFQKQLTQKGNHPVVIAFITYFLLSVVCVFALLYMDIGFLSSDFWIYSILAGIVGALGNAFLIQALQTGDLSVLGPINSYKSVVGIIFGLFLLHEIPNIWGVLGMALIIFGSYFILDTTDERFSWKLFQRPEIRFRTLAMVLTAIEAVLIKKIIIASSPNIAFISWCIAGAFFTFILVFCYRLNLRKEIIHSIRFQNMSLFIFLIVCIGVMQWTTNYAFDHIPVGYALSLFQLSILLSIFFGYRYFQEKDIRKKILGSAIMIVGSILIILLKD